MPILTPGVYGFESERTDTSAVVWATEADASNFFPGADPGLVLLGGVWAVDYSGTYVFTEYQGVFQFSGLSVPAGETITTADLTIPVSFFYKAHRAYLHGVLNADMGVPATNNLASTQTLTTAKAAFTNEINSGWASDVPFNEPQWTNFSAGGGWVPDFNYATIDISAVLNELIQDPSFNDGDPITLVWVYQDVPGYTGYMTATNSNSALGLNAPEVSYSTSSGPVADPTSSVSTDAFVDGTAITVTTSNITAVTNAEVTVGGISEAQTISTGADLHTFTFNRGDLPNGEGVYTFTGDGTTYSHPVDVSPSAGLSWLNVTAPVVTEHSLLYGVSQAILDGDMQFEWNPLSSNSHAATISAGGVPQIAAGVGEDIVFVRFWSEVEGYWGDVFPAEFQDIGFIGSNKINPIAINYILNRPLYIQQGQDFYSVNAPTLKIVDGGREVKAYVDRDNTAEFIFLESGLPVDLSLVTEIRLIVGAFSFSDSTGSFTSKFSKKDGGFLELHFGELGLPIGSHNFYFVLYTSRHTQGIVWNSKEDYIVTLAAD